MGDSTYALLEGVQVVLGEGIGLGNDGDEVDTGAQTLHDLNIEGLKATHIPARVSDRRSPQHPEPRKPHSRMARRADKVQARVDAEVDLLLALGLLLLAHVRLVLVVDEVDDGRPRVAVVDVVAEAGAVDDGELRLELLLLELGLDDLDLGQLVELLLVPLRVVLRSGELGREERVDERRLAETGLAWRRGASVSRSRAGHIQGRGPLRRRKVTTPYERGGTSRGGECSCLNTVAQQTAWHDPPRPYSRTNNLAHRQQSLTFEHKEVHSPTTIIVKCAPRLATILCLYIPKAPLAPPSPYTHPLAPNTTKRTWLGRLAIPMPSENGAAAMASKMERESERRGG